MAVNQWYAPVNFAADSVITDESVESVTIYLKSDQELISELELGVKIDNATKVTMTEASKWYSFTLTVEEWNELCGEKKISIAQTNWNSSSNMNKVSIDMVVTFNKAN